MNPQSGRPITVTPSPLRGERKTEFSAQAVFIITASIARIRVLRMTYCVSGRVKPLLPPPEGRLSDGLSLVK